MRLTRFGSWSCFLVVIACVSSAWAEGESKAADAKTPPPESGKTAAGNGASADKTATDRSEAPGTGAPDAGAKSPPADPDSHDGKGVEATPEETKAKQRRIREFERHISQHMARQRWDDALKEMKELVILDPYNDDFHLTLGLLYRKLNQYKEARRKYEMFLDLGGNPALAHLLMADSYAALSQKDKAFEHLRIAAEHGMNIMRAVKGFEALAPYQTDTEFIKLALQLEKYELNLRTFQDIFTARFRAVVDEDGKDIAAEEEEWPRERQELELRRAKMYLANIEHYLTLGDEARAMDFYSRLLKLLEYQDRFTVPAFATAIRNVVNRKVDIERGIETIRLKFLYDRARALIDTMERHFRGEEYAEVERLYTDLENLAQEIVGINSEFKEVADRVLEAGREKVERAKLRREFNAMPLKIQGIVLSDGPPVAIVNDKILRIGSTFGELLVVKIEANQLLFNFRGELVPLVFRRY